MGAEDVIDDVDDAVVAHAYHTGANTWCRLPSAGLRVVHVVPRSGVLEDGTPVCRRCREAVDIYEAGNP